MSALSKPFCQLVLEIFGHLTGSQVNPESTRPESNGPGVFSECPGDRRAMGWSLTGLAAFVVLEQYTFILA